MIFSPILNIPIFTSQQQFSGKKVTRINPLRPMIHIQILLTYLHTFLLRIVERIWFKIKAFFLWKSIQ